MHRAEASRPKGVGRVTAGDFSRSALRAAVACSRWAALAFIAGTLAASWAIVHFSGGVDRVAPHFYYVPILFGAVRFGPRSALVVALVSGLLAGPLSYTMDGAGTAQELSRWLTRTGLFVGIGQMVAWTLGPTLAPIADEVRRVRTELDIRRGLARNEFYLLYQPIFSLGSGRFVDAEALVRWRDSSGNEIVPADFIPIAERSGLIHEITTFVVNEACQEASRWGKLATQQSVDPWFVSVNFSGRDLESPNLAEDIAEVISRSGLPPELLCVEITESELAHREAGEQLGRLRQLGVRVAIV